MKKEFDRIFKMSIVSWIVFIILGIFLFTKAELTLKIISYIVGGTLLLGLLPITKTLLSKEKKYANFSFIIEVFMVVAGIIIILNTELIASIIPILIGILMLINGISKLQFALCLKGENVKVWITTLILSIIVIIGGILFLTNPFGGAIAITKIIGLFIIIYSVIDMFDFLIIHKNIKNVKETETKILKNDNIKIIEEDE